MRLEAEIVQLRRHLDELAGRPDADLARYALQRPPLPPGVYWRLRWFAGWCLRCLESMRPNPRNPWPPGLRQVAGSARAKPLLIWAVGTDRDTLRAACGGFADLQRSLPGFAPVLVTDVTDFAFFSRLGWLVEYLPALSGEGLPYDERKARFLARLYRRAPVLPARAGLEMESCPEEIRRWAVRGRRS
jgi:hypothetical protein